MCHFVLTSDGRRIEADPLPMRWNESLAYRRIL